MRSKKNYRGGSGSGPSAWSYVYNTVGSGYDQFKNALTLQPGENLGSMQSNDIEPKNNLNAQNTEGMPTKADLSLIQKAGSKRRRRRGGNMGAIANQALVPFSLLALQQTIGKRKRKSKGGNMGAIANQALAPLSLLALQQGYAKGRRSSSKTRKGRSRKGRKSRKSKR